jgi:hypothetical protein
VLTETERAASCMMGVEKCETCHHVSNVTINGISVCSKGLSPKYCAIYKLKPEIALRQAQEAFK